MGSHHQPDWPETVISEAEGSPDINRLTVPAIVCKRFKPVAFRSVTNACRYVEIARKAIGAAHIKGDTVISCNRARCTTSRPVSSNLEARTPFPGVVDQCQIGRFTTALDCSVIDTRNVTRKGKPFPANADTQIIGNRSDAQCRRRACRDSVRFADSVA